MKKFKVTISHIVGYYPANDEGDSEPILKLTEVEVEAESEKDAIKMAKDADNTKWSVYESYADEIED